VNRTARALLLSILGACAQTQAPDATLARSTAPSATFAPTGAPLPSSAPQPIARTDAAAEADATPTPSAPAKAPEPAEAPLLDNAGQPLPQTDDRPSTSSPYFQKRIELLARAIVEDNPELAVSTFFPLVAYRQVKDVARPERDYELRLLANFRRDIHDYHKKLGRDASQAKLAGVDVPEESARFMKPGSEGNKVGYFRVLRSTLRFTLPSGHEKKLELTSLISWRGEWYVVHVAGFK
jgi:hypothetical protein